MFVIFLVYRRLTSPRNSVNSKETFVLYFVSSSLVFLLLAHDEFFDAFQGTKFRLKTVCLFQRLTIEQFIRKSWFHDRLFACCLLRKLFFFLCFRSELTTEAVLHGQFAWIKIRSQNVHFYDSFRREQNLAAAKLFLSLTCIVRPYAFDRPCHFDAYGPHTGRFLLWFSKEIVRGVERVIW